MIIGMNQGEIRDEKSHYFLLMGLPIIIEGDICFHEGKQSEPFVGDSPKTTLEGYRPDD
jgi:hypothetical protein